MRTIIRDVIFTDSVDKRYSVTIENKRISQIIEGEPIVKLGDEIIEGCGNLLTSGFYNAHGHSAMTALRGYADNNI